MTILSISTPQIEISKSKTDYSAYQDLRTSGQKKLYFVFPDILVSGIPCLRQVLIAWSPDSL